MSSSERPLPAECAAKRRIIQQWEDYTGDSLWGFDVLGVR